MLDEVIPWIRAEDAGRADLMGDLDASTRSASRRGRAPAARTGLARDRRATSSAGSIATAPVLDIACDRGYFIRHVRAGERWATDIRDVSAELPADVHFVQADGLGARATSCRPALRHRLHEQLPRAPAIERTAVIEQLRVAAPACSGRAVASIVLQPNIRLVGARVLGLHRPHVALTERSLAEAAAIAGSPRGRARSPASCRTRRRAGCRATRSSCAATSAFPPAWRLLGQQTLYVGERR